MKRKGKRDGGFMKKRDNGILILVIALLVAAAMTGVQKRQTKRYVDTISSKVQQTEEKPRVFLTFDDGPSCLTGEYLDILKKHHIKATFFVIGQQVAEMPELVRRELKEGHEVGVHTYTHESCDIYKSSDAYYEDVEKVRSLLKKKFDHEAVLWRFPWGSANCYIRSYKDDIISRLRGKNMEYTDWNVSAEDSVGCPDTSSIMANIRKDAFRVNEPVVLMHDSGSNRATLESLESIITLFEEKGYEFGTVSQRKNCCHFGQ